MDTNCPSNDVTITGLLSLGRDAEGRRGANNECHNRGKVDIPFGAANVGQSDIY